jgi:hypothetical protein
VSDEDRGVSARLLLPICNEVEDHAPCYIALLESVEDLMDGRQGLPFDIGFACRGEGQRFGPVLPSADERTTNSDAVGHHTEEWDGEFAGRQPDQDASTALPDHADALLERAE